MVPEAGHVVDTSDPIHEWTEQGIFIRFIDGAQLLVLHCTGCPAQKNVAVPLPHRLLVYKPENIPC